MIQRPKSSGKVGRAQDVGTGNIAVVDNEGFGPFWKHSTTQISWYISCPEKGE